MSEVDMLTVSDPALTASGCQRGRQQRGHDHDADRVGQPDDYGQLVTFTATVSPSTATGTVTFMMARSHSPGHRQRQRRGHADTGLPGHGPSRSPRSYCG